MGARWRQGLERSLPVVALVACILWVHAQSLTGAARLTAHHDNLDGAAPLRIEAARQWRSGHLPLWNPYKRAGMPLLADTTAGAIYPGNFPFLFIAATSPSRPQPATSTSDSEVFRAMDRVAALHAVLAGLFMFVFLRTIDLGNAASMLGALVYACSGTMGWFAAWYIQIQNSVVWLPLILAAVHRVASDDARCRRWIAIGAAAVALQWLAGYPETSFYSGLLAIGYAASLIRKQRSWQPVTAVAVIYVAGIALAAVQLVPALELQALSRRPGSLSLDVFQSLPASVSMIPAWFLPSGAPGLEFPPLAAYHFGAAAVVAAAAGAAAWSRGSGFFALAFVAGFLLSLGAATPVSGWAWQLPVLGAFRHPFKHLFEMSFAMAALAAIGAGRVVSRPRGASARWPAAIVVAAIAFCCVSLRINQAALVSGNPPSVDVSGSRPEVLHEIAPGWRLLTPRQIFQKRDPAFVVGDYATEFEVPAVHGAGPYLWTELAAATGMIEEEITFRPGLFGATDHTLALLSCRYLLQTRRGGTFTPAVDLAVYHAVGEAPQWRLMERADALPLLRFVDEVRCADDAAIAASLHGGMPEPGDTALVACTQGDQLPASLTARDWMSVNIESERAGHVVATTVAPAGGRGFLVVGQSDFPGWKARVNDLPVTIRRVHGLVQGIEVPGGNSRVELCYEPRSFTIGATISMLTLVLLLLVSLTGRPVRSEGSSTTR